MQLKMCGKFHIKLNIGERPIANKYREGKMKRTLKRELKVREIVKRETLEVSRTGQDSAFGCTFWLVGQHQFRLRYKDSWNVALRSVIAFCRMPRMGLRNAACPQGSVFGHVTCLGCWQNGFKRPVLKHGPRSLTYLRVFGW